MSIKVDEKRRNVNLEELENSSGESLQRFGENIEYQKSRRTLATAADKSGMNRNTCEVDTNLAS